MNVEQIFAQLIQFSVPEEALSGTERLKTARRAAAFWQERLEGYKQDARLIAQEALYEATNHDLVKINKIALTSICEHHLLPFSGFCYISYLPDRTWLGLSKFARIVDVYAKRLQLQERLTDQIAQALNDILKPQAISVTIKARHNCITMRGIERRESSVVTTRLLGLFAKDPTWQPVLKIGYNSSFTE